MTPQQIFFVYWLIGVIVITRFCVKRIDVNIGMLIMILLVFWTSWPVIPMMKLLELTQDIIIFKKRPK